MPYCVIGFALFKIENERDMKLEPELWNKRPLSYYSLISVLPNELIFKSVIIRVTSKAF